MKSILRATMLCFVLASASLAQSSAANGIGEIEVYGSLIWLGGKADTIFVVNPIESGDSFAFRQALREHEILNIVLASPGGSIYEALQISEVIRDRNIRTYIPKDGICESACAFLFLSGTSRTVDGKLGVHQFYTSTEIDQISSEVNTQYTVSEIIAFLNRYNVPAWIYEDMFRSPEMYYFTTDELLQLQLQQLSANERVVFSSTHKILKDFLSKLQAKPEEVASQETSLPNTHTIIPSPVAHPVAGDPPTAEAPVENPASWILDADQLSGEEILARIAAAPISQSVRDTLTSTYNMVKDSPAAVQGVLDQLNNAMGL